MFFFHVSSFFSYSFMHSYPLYGLFPMRLFFSTGFLVLYSFSFIFVHHKCLLPYLIDIFTITFSSTICVPKFYLINAMPSASYYRFSYLAKKQTK